MNATFVSEKVSRKTFIQAMKAGPQSYLLMVIMELCLTTEIGAELIIAISLRYAFLVRKK